MIKSVIKSVIGNTGNAITGKASGSWSSYWLTRTPSNLVGVVISATRIDLTWDDAVEEADGLKIYLSTDGGVTYTYNSTVAFGVEAKSLTGLSANTYTIKLVAYKGVNESNPVTTSIRISTLLTGLVDYWKLDEASGNATGVNGNVLVNTNSVTYAAGMINNGASLGTGNTNKKLVQASAYGMTYQSSHTISFWVSIISQPPTSGQFRLCALMFGTNPGTYTSVLYTNLTGNILLSLSGGETAQVIKTLTTDAWYRFCITHNPVGNVMKLYINGVLTLTNTSFTGNYSTFTTQLDIGAFALTAYSSAMFDEIGLWNKILSGPEIIEDSICLAHPFSKVVKPILAGVGYCWFARPRALYNAVVDKTWIGIVHNDGSGFSQHILTLDNATGLATTFKVGTITEYDDHNEPSLFVRASDGKLFTAYTEHAKVGSPIRYRISTNARDASAWGAEQTVDPNNPNRYTYASCFESAAGNVYIFYRDSDVGGSRWAYIKSTDGGANWGADVIFNNKTYHNIVQRSTNKDILHFVSSYAPTDNVNPNVVTHFYFNCSTDTFHKSDGTDVTANIPLADANMTTILSLAHPEQSWIEDITLDSNGYPRVLMTYLPNVVTTEILKKLYYSEWTGAAWTAPYEIHESNNKNMCIVLTSKSYAPLAYFDRGNPDRIFAAKEVSGITEIFLLTRVAANSFTSVQKTSGSIVDQWRPFTVNSSKYNVFWLNKTRYYQYVNDFAQQLMVDTL